MDYSDLYFRKIKKAAMPLRRGGKFVQILDEANDNEYLVLSPKDLSIYHANIVERFCAQKGIEGSYNGKKDFFAIYEMGWAVMGGGFWMVDDAKKTLELSGVSQMYGAFEAAGLKNRIFNSGAFPEYSFFVNGF